jgi:hypothetical protein
MNMNTISNLALHADGRVVDTTTGNSFHVSPTGLVIMRWLMENRSGADIVEQLALKFHVTIGRALRDLNDVRLGLLSVGLL